MADTKSEIRRRIRAILDDEESLVIELPKVMTEAGNFDTAFQAAEAERKKEKNTVKKAVITNLISRIHWDSNRFEEAEKEARKSAEKKKLPNPVKAYAYCMIGAINLRREEYAQTEANCKKALALIDEKEDAVLVHVLNLIGVVHYLKGKYSLALEYHKLHKEVSERTGNKTQLIRAVGNLAITLFRLGRSEEAIEYLMQAREIGIELGDKISLGYTMNNLASYHTGTGEPKKVIAEAKEALRIFKEIGHKWMFTDCHLNFAKAYLEQGENDTAAKHAAKALSYAEEMDQKTNVPRAHELLGKILSAQNNPVAGTHFRKSIELFESMPSDGDPEGVEFVMLAYGKYLLGQDEPGGKEYLEKAARILKKRPPTIQVKHARKELSGLLESIPKKLFPAREEEVVWIEQDRDNLRKILEITKAINSEKETEKVLELILDTAIETSGAERGFIAFFENSHWKYETQRNFVGDIESEPDYPTIREIVTDVMSNGTVLTAGNIAESESAGRIITTPPRTLKGVFTFPLAIKEKLFGAVYLDSRFVVTDIPPETIDFLVTLMEQVALIIDKAQLYEEVRTLSEKLGEKLEETRSELEKKQHELEQRYSYKNIIGKGAKMQKLFLLLDKVVETELPVYISGDSGTGKELIAKAIHYNGTRKKKHFVALNCAAIPESLLESELFGHEKGAFTGADATKKGLFEIAGGGTFFMDEIGNMSATMQQKLLRVLQEKTIRRIGGKKSIAVNARIISASNIDPRQLVDDGSLREDLFYRLNVLTINLPPLRERVEDIPLLVEHFWEKATGVSPESSQEEKGKFLNLLMNYDWPGNIRELENEIYRVASIGEKVFDTEYLSKHILKGPPGEQVSISTERVSLKDLEELFNEKQKSLILAALKQAKGNKAKAAKILDIPRTSLINKIKKHQVFYAEVSP
ncbi:MAG: tetratricopeptide repeat protein [Planctomycetota bacterium]|nr:MAG: tetratricopeptide repeat protein [Planctomycetota bacterium]